MRQRTEYDEVDRWLRWGLNDCQISRLTGVPRGTVLSWRHLKRPPGRGPRLLDGGCPLCTGSTLQAGAYAYLLGLYLGDGYLSSFPRGVFRLRIALDQRYPGIISEAKGAIETIRPRRRAGQTQLVGCVEVSSYWQHWPCLFPQHGPSRKHLRPIVLLDWQRQITSEYPHKLLRGLIHSDGYRGLNWAKGKGYPRYQFSNRSADILQIFCRACDDLGVRWRRMNRVAISVARAPDVAKLDAVIGPKA